MEEERKIRWVTDSLARESSVAKCKERRNTCNDNGDLTSNGEWAKCKCMAAGDGSEASACNFLFEVEMVFILLSQSKNGLTYFVKTFNIV